MQVAGAPGGVSVPAVRNTQWQVQAAGDFDGDGVDDLFWRNPYEGRNTIWLSASFATKKAVDPLVGEGWLVAGAGDFDGNGLDDIVWRNWQTGETIRWPDADGSRAEHIAWVLPADWHVAAIGDYNGDGNADLLWRQRSDGDDIIWHGGDPLDTRMVARVADRKWKPVPARPWECDRDRARWAFGEQGSPELYETMMHAAQARHFSTWGLDSQRNRLTIGVHPYDHTVVNASCT